VDAVTSENAAISDWLGANTWTRRPVVIPKSVRWPLSEDAPALSPDVACTAGHKIILAAGRLAPVKGFDSLLRAFARVAEGRDDWDLVIVGEGPCRKQLESHIGALGMQDRVRLPGQVGNMAAWYERATIFAVSSLHEGGPNTLIEALAYGVPAVSFDCDTGPRTIIRDNVDGILVPPRNETALADGLASLMDDAALRARMAARAVEARERFSEEHTLEKWDELFQLIGVI
jgi:glycosyltransferase involved in cell wall biosynthesis